MSLTTFAIVTLCYLSVLYAIVYVQDCGRTALMRVAANDNADTAAELVRLGADVNTQDWVRAWPRLACAVP
jgi:hypothetical protein